MLTNLIAFVMPILYVKKAQTVDSLGRRKWDKDWYAKRAAQQAAELAASGNVDDPSAPPRKGF